MTTAKIAAIMVTNVHNSMRLAWPFANLLPIAWLAASDFDVRDSPAVTASMRPSRKSSRVRLRF